MQERKTEESGEPEKAPFSLKKKMGRKEWSALAGGLAFLILLTAGIYFYAFDEWTFMAAPWWMCPEIPQAGILRTPWKRRASSGAAAFSGSIPVFLEAAKSQSGTYKMKQGLTIKEVMTELRSGKTESVFVTVPEGYGAPNFLPS